MGEGSWGNELQLEVRDYECDLQGVVNNAVYQHYMEHARHRWMEQMGLDFAALHAQGIDLVVVRVEIDYRFPLRSRDRFVVRSALEREGRLRIICRQHIHRLADDKIISQATVVSACLQNGRPAMPAVIEEKFNAAVQASVR